MGVKGFAQYLKSLITEDGFSQIIDPNKTVLLVDASAFAFYSMRLSMNLLKIEFGGDYGTYGDYIHMLFDAWIAMGFKIMIITDSSDVVEAKQKVKLQRRQQDVKKIANILNILHHSDAHDSIATLDRQLPVPTLMITECMWRIEQYHMQNKVQLIKVIKGEADPVLGILGRNIPNSLVLSTDTDFMFIDGIRYSPFEQFHGFVASVFTCENVANALDIPKSRMPYLAVFLGNDYSSGVPNAKQVPSRIEQFRNDLKIDNSLQGNIGIDMYRNCDYVGMDPISYLKKKGIIGEKTKRQQDKSLSVSRQCWNIDHPQTAILRSKIIEVFSVLDSITFKTGENFQSVFLDCFQKCSPMYLNVAKFSFERGSQQPNFVGDNEAKFTQALIFQIVFQYVYERFEGKKIPPSSAFRPEAFFAHLQPYVPLSPAQRTSVVQSLLSMAIARKEQFEKYNTEPGTSTEKAEPDVILPVDGYKEEILQRINNTQVTLIHGETGSGKSSKIPLYLIQEDIHNKVIVCQPRRTAAHSLFEYMRNKIGLKDIVGMRMGGGIKEETSATRLWYVTTGYLQKFAADPERMKGFTHVIIDEVHERSVDNDMMCYYAKTLIKANPNIKLILMSATLQHSQYQEYFDIKEKALFVGVKRFPRQELWIEAPEMRQLLSSEDDKGKLYKAVLADLQSEVEKHTYSYAANLSRKLPKSCESKLLTLVLYLVRAIRKKQRDTGILIFVSGIAEIQDLFSIFESEDPAGNHFDLVAIHSSIPFEEQRQAWSAKNKLLTRVIVATNSAESSVTLPDVDHVICLGAKNVAEYDVETESSLLGRTWISRSSAEQRAGRTGRVRPGTVYRMYPKALFKIMKAFDSPEILMSSLDDVVLDLKNVTNGAVLPIMKELMDAPKPLAITQALDNLYSFGLLQSREDETSQTTDLGKTVARMGVDVRSGMLICKGIVLGIPAEASALAAILTCGENPFRIVSPLVLRDPIECHQVLMTVMQTKYEMDGGLFSEPLMLIRLLATFSRVPMKNQKWFCVQKGLVYKRLQTIRSMYRNIADKLTQSLGFNKAIFQLEHPNLIFANPQKLNRLRFLVASASIGNIFSLEKRKCDCDFSSSDDEDYDDDDDDDDDAKSIRSYYVDLEHQETSYVKYIFEVTRAMTAEDLLPLFSKKDNGFLLKHNVFENSFRASGLSHEVDTPKTWKWKTVLSSKVAMKTDTLALHQPQPSKTESKTVSLVDIAINNVARKPWCLITCDHTTTPEPQMYIAIVNDPKLVHSFQTHVVSDFQILNDEPSHLVLCQDYNAELDTDIFTWISKTVIPFASIDILDDERLEVDSNVDIPKKDLVELVGGSWKHRKLNKILATDSIRAFLSTPKDITQTPMIKDHPLSIKCFLGHLMLNRKVGTIKLDESKKVKLFDECPGYVCAPTTWRIPRSEFMDFEAIGERNVFLRNHTVRTLFLEAVSVEATARIPENETVFGVAANVQLIKGQGARAKSAFLSSITLFPPGDKWIQLVLACHNTPVCADFASENMDLCSAFSECMYEALVEASKLKESPRLLHLFDSIFENKDIVANPIDEVSYSISSSLDD